MCSSRTDDLDPAHRTLRVRADTTKNQLERVVPYFDADRRTAVRLPGPPSDDQSSSRSAVPVGSPRNHAQPLSLWTWSKVVRRIALAADVPRFATHTTRHLCLTNLARMGRELHALATFAGHRSTESMLAYIHLSGRDLADKLNSGMEQVHGGRPRSRRPRLSLARGLVIWSDTTAVSTSMRGSWRRSAASGGTCVDGAAMIRKLRNGLSSNGFCVSWMMPERRCGVRTPRIITDEIGLVLLRCAEENTTYWSWSEDDWQRLIGASSDEFESPWPSWIDGTVRPYVAAYAYLLASFITFHRLGNLNKLALARRMFGQDTVEQAITRISDMLSTWGYCMGQEHGDKRLPTVVCQALLLSPRLADFTTDAFQRL